MINGLIVVTILKCIDISNQYMCTDLHSAVGQLCFKNKQANKQTHSERNQICLAKTTLKSSQFYSQKCKCNWSSTFAWIVAIFTLVFS